MTPSINDDLFDEALNEISNYESSEKPTKPNYAQEEDLSDKLKEMFDNMGENIADEFINQLPDIDIGETNELIESVLDELVSKDILYEPFICMKEKLEKEMEAGNKTHQKGLELIKQIINMLDEQDKAETKGKNNEKLMELIFELQEQGDLWQAIAD